MSPSAAPVRRSGGARSTQRKVPRGREDEEPRKQYMTRPKRKYTRLSPSKWAELRAYPIAIRTKKPARRCGATGQPPAWTARSSLECTTGRERRITRWEHEHLLDAVQQRLDANPQAMRQRREAVEHPFGADQGAHGSDALPDQNLAQGLRRKWRLQFSLTISPGL